MCILFSFCPKIISDQTVFDCTAAHFVLDLYGVGKSLSAQISVHWWGTGFYDSKRSVDILQVFF